MKVDAIAGTVLAACVLADWFVGILYLYDKRGWAAGYWIAAGVISFCAWRGLK